MQQYKLSKEKLPEFLSGIIQSGKKLYAPVENNGSNYFAEVKEVGSIADVGKKTKLSAKSVFFPRCEELVKFEGNGENTKIIEPEAVKEGVLYGIKPCDASGMDYFKDFYTKENADKLIADRFEKTTIISCSCNEATDTCFCTSIGSNPGNTRGSDLNITDMGDSGFLVEVVTDRGASLLEAYKNIMSQASDVDKTKYLAEPQIRFDINKVKANIDKIYDADFWQAESDKCLSCASCAFSCPTCTCFDIQDEKNPHESRRLRLWDSCGFDLFTVHASGHNPREVQTERWRHRILHKFKYSVDTMGQLSCTGCGRCIDNCPAGMNIIDTMIKISEA